MVVDGISRGNISSARNGIDSGNHGDYIYISSVYLAVLHCPSPHVILDTDVIYLICTANF